MFYFRYRLLVTHSCVQALNSMLADVGPISEMLHLDNQDFGPKTEEYDPKTTVWTVWFRKDGQAPALSESDLIFNFYGWPGSVPGIRCNDFYHPAAKRQHPLEIQSFPDNLTKKPAYIMVSETLYTDANYGYMNIAKDYIGRKWHLCRDACERDLRRRDGPDSRQGKDLVRQRGRTRD